MVGQRHAGAFVLIRVTENNVLLTERRYDESFFRAGRLDELTLQGSSARG